MQSSYHCIRSWLQIAPLILLAGCWQEIEYKPPAKQSPAAKSAAPSAAMSEAAQAPPASSYDQVTPAAVEPQPIAAPNSLPLASKPKNDGDRYATAASDQRAVSTTTPSANDGQSGTPQPPIARHTDATAVSATVDVAPQKASPNTRRAAWQLGSRLSLAALAHDRGLAPTEVPGWLEEARAAAKLLGTTVPDLPEAAPPGDKSPASKQVLDYMGLQYQRIVHDLTQQHGADHAALFEIALKSNLLLLLYSPGSSNVETVSSTITRQAPQAGLPSELWKPLLELLGRQPPLGDVRAGVRQMHNAVDQYLANAGEPARQ